MDGQYRIDRLFRSIIGHQYSWLDRLRIAFTVTVYDGIAAIVGWLKINLAV